MPGAISYYDWMLPENQDVGVIPPSIVLADSSTGGVAVGTLANLYEETLSTVYGRTGIDRSLSELFLLDITTNLPVLGQTQATYGTVAAMAVKVRNNAGAYVDAKVTLTIDANSGSFGGGTVYSQVVYVAAADTEGQASYPNRNAVFFPWASSLDAATIRAGGKGGTSRNKVRIKIEPVAGTGGSTGVPVYDVQLSRVILARTFFSEVRNSGMVYQSDDQSVVQRSYSGTPYVAKKPIMRKVSAQFAPLTRAQIFGMEDTTEYKASMQAVNGFAGASRGVIFSPRLTPPTDEQSGGVFLQSWGNEHIFGIMDRALTATMISTVNTDDKELWDCSLTITETPQP